MLRTFSTRRHLAVAAGTFFIGGCSYYDLFENPKGVTTPQPLEIAQYVSQAEVTDAALGRPVTAGEYLIASLGYTNERCHAFFDTLERFRDDNSLFGKLLDAAAAAGTPLLGYTTGSGDALRFASAIALGKQANTSLGEIYTYVAHRDQLKRHVLIAMADFRRLNGLTALTRSLIGVNEFRHPAADQKHNPIYYPRERDPDCQADNYEIVVPNNANVQSASLTYSVNQCRLNDFLRSDAPIHLLVARNIATEYASLCSLSHLKSIIGDALGKTETKVKGGDSSATTAVPIAEAASNEASAEAQAAAATAQKAASKAINAAQHAEHAADDSKSAAANSEQSARDAKVATDPPPDH